MLKEVLTLTKRKDLLQQILFSRTPFYVLVTSCVFVFLLASFTPLGAYVTTLLLIATVCLSIICFGNEKVFLFLMASVLLLPERLSGYYTRSGYALYSIYGVKLFGVSIVYWMVFAYVAVWSLRFLHFRRIVLDLNLLFFAYLVIAPFLIGIANENGLRAIFPDMASFAFLLLSATITKNFVAREPLFRSRALVFLIFCLQLRCAGAMLVNLLWPFLGAAIYLNYTKYLNPLVIVFSILITRFAKVSVGYRLFSAVTGLFAVLEMVYASDRKQFILTFSFVAMFLVILFRFAYGPRTLNILRRRNLRSMFNHISVFVVGLIILCMLLPWENFLPKEILGRAVYKFQTSIPLGQGGLGNPSLDMRLQELVTIWKSILSDCATLLCGRGFGSFFQFQMPVPSTWLGIGSYTDVQKKTGMLQPHTVVNFLLLKSGLLGLGVYCWFYFAFFMKLYRFARRTAVSFEVFLVTGVLASIPSLFLVGYFSQPLAFTSGILYGIFKNGYIRL